MGRKDNTGKLAQGEKKLVKRLIIRDLFNIFILIKFFIYFNKEKHNYESIEMIMKISIINK